MAKKRLRMKFRRSDRKFINEKLSTIVERFGDHLRGKSPNRKIALMAAVETVADLGFDQETRKFTVEERGIAMSKQAAYLLLHLYLMGDGFKLIFGIPHDGITHVPSHFRDPIDALIQSGLIANDSTGLDYVITSEGESLIREMCGANPGDDLDDDISAEELLGPVAERN